MKHFVFPDKYRARRQAGFTLIEILIVIVIIGILAAIGLGNFMSSQQKARDARRKSDLKQIGIALESIFADYGRYPASSTEGHIGCGEIAVEDELEATFCPWGTPLVDDKGTLYMVEIPRDPGAFRYFYQAPADGSYYMLFARLENEQDPGALKSEDGNPRYFVDTLCGTNLMCNFVVASTNLLPSNFPMAVEE